MDLDDDTLGLVADAAYMAPYGGGLLATCRRARAVGMAALSRAAFSSRNMESAVLSRVTLTATGGLSTPRTGSGEPRIGCPSEHRLERTLALLRQSRGLKKVYLRDRKQGFTLSDEAREQWLAAWRAVGTVLGHSCPALTTMSVSGIATAVLGGLLGDAIAGRPATDLKGQRLSTGVVLGGGASGAARALRRLVIELDRWEILTLAPGRGDALLPSLKELNVDAHSEAVMTVDDAAAIVTMFPGLTRLSICSNTLAGVGRVLSAAASLTDLCVYLWSPYTDGVKASEVAALLHGRAWERLDMCSATPTHDEDLGSGWSLDVVAAIRGVAAFPRVLGLGQSGLTAPATWALLAHPTASERLRELVMPHNLQLHAITVPLGRLPRLVKLDLTVSVYVANVASLSTCLWEKLPALRELHMCVRDRWTLSPSMREEALRRVLHSLLSAPFAPVLESLSLNQRQDTAKNTVTVDWVVALLEGLPALRTLTVSAWMVYAPDLSAVVARRFPRLTLTVPWPE